MLNPVVSFLVYIFEMLVAYFLFSAVSEKKRAAGFILLIGILLYGIGSLVNLAFSNNVIINFAFTFLIHALFALLCFKLSFKAVVVYVTIMYVFMAAFEFITVFLVSAIIGTDIDAYNTSPAMLLMELPLSKTLYLLSCMALASIPRGKLPMEKMPFCYYFFPICVLLVLISFWYICAHESISESGQTIFAIIGASLLGSTVLLLIDHRHNAERNREYITIKGENDRLQTEKAYYDVLERQNQELMIYAHDAKKHLDAIKNLNTGERVNEYINKLSEQIVNYASGCQSGNKLLDVIINKYVTECEIRGLELKYDVRVCNLREVEDIDLVAIIGNLMDNALTAAEKSAGKSIELYTTRHNRYSVLVISNSCDTAPVSDGTRLITTKAERPLHGFGIKSVKQTLKKYGGDLDWNFDEAEHSFTMTVMIGPREEERVKRSIFASEPDY